MGLVDGGVAVMSQGLAKVSFCSDPLLEGNWNVQLPTEKALTSLEPKSSLQS